MALTTRRGLLARASLAAALGGLTAGAAALPTQATGAAAAALDPAVGALRRYLAVSRAYEIAVHAGASTDALGDAEAAAALALAATPATTPAGLAAKLAGLAVALEALDADLAPVADANAPLWTDAREHKLALGALADALVLAEIDAASLTGRAA